MNDDGWGHLLSFLQLLPVLETEGDDGLILPLWLPLLPATAPGARGERSEAGQSHRLADAELHHPLLHQEGDVELKYEMEIEKLKCLNYV